MSERSLNMRLLCFIVPLLAVWFGPPQSAFSLETGQTDSSVDADLAGLKSPDPQVRIDALRSLQTSLDPRIPDAMLPLLADEGESIRRLAARAVGSRWWQIPQKRNPRFLDALVALQKAEDKDSYGVKNMTERALGLLRRDYRSKMFARSKNKRWVIYERRRLRGRSRTTGIRRRVETGGGSLRGAATGAHGELWQVDCRHAHHDRGARAVFRVRELEQRCPGAIPDRRRDRGVSLRTCHPRPPPSAAASSI